MPKSPKHDAKIALGDFDAKVRREEVFRPTSGCQSKYKESKNNDPIMTHRLCYRI